MACFTADSRQQNATLNKNHTICNCFEVIPGQREKRGVVWPAGTQKLISKIFYDRMMRMRLNARQWPVLRLIQDSKTPLGMENRIMFTFFQVIPGQRGKKSVEWSAPPQTLISTIFYGPMTCISLSVRHWPILRLIQDSKTPLGMENRNIFTCFDVIPGFLLLLLFTHIQHIVRTYDSRQSCLWLAEQGD